MPGTENNTHEFVHIVLYSILLHYTICYHSYYSDSFRLWRRASNCSNASVIYSSSGVHTFANC